MVAKALVGNAKLQQSSTTAHSGLSGKPCIRSSQHPNDAGPPPVPGQSASSAHQLISSGCIGTSEL